MNKSEMLQILQEEGIIIKEETKGYTEVMQDMEYYSELLREEGAGNWYYIKGER